MFFKKVPSSLRSWFLVHFIVDFVIAIPLFLYPYESLLFLGWTGIDPLATRLVAAALFAVGGASYLMYQSGFKVYNSMINLKLIWSFTASAACLLTIYQGAPQMAWVIFAIFFAFFIIWAYYKRHLKSL